MWVDPVQVSYAHHQTCQLDEIVWGRLSTGAVLALWNFEWLRESLTTPGRPLAGGRIPDSREQDGVVAVSFILNRQVPRGQSELLAGIGVSGYMCTIPAG